ncbi:type IV secretion system protein [Bartonella sp. F02]|uniref:type IV secretion system protein n=1 Tax=Bartonella sp. F02 TaxID=2967262 RepID=UPI0022A9B837|nr:type IV secretion system protein [Bartonella sp. F02]MCZ2328767.1 conjugal transfer protein [Bartonella sp. F02]
MKKLIGTAVVLSLFGVSNSALAFNVSSSPFVWGRSYETPIDLSGLLDIFKEKLEVIKEQNKDRNTFYASITNAPTKQLTALAEEHNDFFLKETNRIYKQSGARHPSTRLTSIENIIKEEKLSVSLEQARQQIEKRGQYTTLTDKAISLQSFQKVQANFNRLKHLLKNAKNANDLKSIAELQAYIKSELAMIQNEVTKLQMVAHLHDAEQELIHQQKYERNIKILHRNNNQMPKIR